MKIHSLQFKFLVTVISAILIITVFVGGLSIYEVDNYLQRHTEEFVEITCENEASQINSIFDNIENSVRIMESYVVSLLNRIGDIRNREYQQTALKLASDLFVDIAANTDGALAYYMRFTPEISDNTSGIFYSKLKGGEEFVRLEPTDLSLYDKSDVEHVGWYWQPYEARHAIWMTPYHNQNTDSLIISFIIPLYFEDEFVGIVGMDYDYTILTSKTHSIKVFENGFAHLELDGTVIHSGDDHPDENHTHDDESYFTASKELANGMTLVLFASRSDIWQIRLDIAYKIILTVVPLAVAFTLIVLLIVKKIVRLLEVLTDASKKLSDENFDIKIEHSDTYEIQQLSAAFENMLVKLQEHKKIQHLLTYRDPLTGLRNTTSYKAWVVDFNKKIESESISFGVVVLDLNLLKKTNDTYGHNIGNNLIKAAAKIISDTFKRSPVFRIGGDEFVAILQNHDLEEREQLFADFASACASAFVDAGNGTVPVSIAKGFSMFNPETDTHFYDVFNRADDDMYKNKNGMKMGSV